MSTHVLDTAEVLDRFIVLHEGKVICARRYRDYAPLNIEELPRGNLLCINDRGRCL